MFFDNFTYSPPMVNASQRPRLIEAILAGETAKFRAILSEGPLPPGLCLFGVLTRKEGEMDVSLFDRNGERYTDTIPAHTPTQMLNMTFYPDYVEAEIDGEMFHAEVKIDALRPRAQLSYDLY